MADGIGTVEFEVEVQYLIDNWKHSALATFDQGVTVADPGHGLDEVSPVSVIGIPFDPDEAADVAPFAPQDLRDVDGQDGVGFIAVELKPSGPAVVMSPGAQPEMREDHRLDILIVTPGRRGPALAMTYTGALAMIFRRLHLTPSQAGIDNIRNLIPPPERPLSEGDDGDWRYDRLVIPMSRFYRAPSAPDPSQRVFEAGVFEAGVFQ